MAENTNFSQNYGVLVTEKKIIICAYFGHYGEENFSTQFSLEIR
jgi:hypothetical protein